MKVAKYHRDWELDFFVLSSSFSSAWVSWGLGHTLFILEYPSPNIRLNIVAIINVSRKNHGLNFPLHLYCHILISHSLSVLYSLCSILYPCELPPAGKLFSFNLTRIAVKSVLFIHLLNNSSYVFIHLSHTYSPSDYSFHFFSFKPSCFSSFLILFPTEKLQPAGESSFSAEHEFHQLSFPPVSIEQVSVLFIIIIVENSNNVYIVGSGNNPSPAAANFISTQPDHDRWRREGKIMPV